MPNFRLPASAGEARAVQDALRPQLRLADEFGELRHVTGIDVGYDVARNLAHASVMTLALDGLAPVEQAQAFAPAVFPYIPGLLSFREIPAILAAMSQLTVTPDLLMVDGQGIAHPRRLGIAAHLGLLVDLPSIGVAKSLLTGRYESVGLRKGERAPLMDRGEQIGVVLRSRDNVQPLIISPGHRVSMETAVAITQRCLTRYRLPEPTRLADKLSKCGSRVAGKQLTLLAL